MIDKDSIDTVSLCRCTCGSPARICYDHVGTNMYECNIVCSNPNCTADNRARGADITKTAPRWDNAVKTDVKDDFVKIGGKWILADKARYRGDGSNSLFGDEK